MAALAYALLPFSGLIAYVTGGRERVRFHGAQAMVFSTLWAVSLYLASMLASFATMLVAVLGCAVWVLLIAGTALGRDPVLPGLSGPLWKAAGAASDPEFRAEP